MYVGVRLMSGKGRGKDNYLPHTLGHEGCGEIVVNRKKVKKFKKVIKY